MFERRRPRRRFFVASFPILIFNCRDGPDCLIANNSQTVAATSKPAAVTIRAWCLADFSLCSDGTIRLRPRVPNDDELDTWIRVSEAATVLGVKRTNLYGLITDGFLVFRKPLRGVVQVSLKSLRSFQVAIGDTEFWENPDAQNRILKSVEQTLCKMAESALRA